jgi:hypothetical protein
VTGADQLVIGGMLTKALPFTPLSNALLETWFLWTGFYNFYLGMAMVPLGIGFYARRSRRLTIRAAGRYSTGICPHSFALSHTQSTRALRIPRDWARSIISSGRLRRRTAGCLDLSDYQAPSADFPVIFKSTLDHDMQFKLPGLENPSPDESVVLDSIRHDLSLPIDYAPKAAIFKATASLDSGMRLIAQSPAPPFVRVYQRMGAH